MGWLRIDDQAMLNPKLGELTDREFRALVGLWCYCARRRREGFFDRSEVKHAGFSSPDGSKNVTATQLAKFIRLGLVDLEGEQCHIHDWPVYQPKDNTSTERVKRYRERLRNEDETRSSHYRNSDSRTRDPVPSRPVTHSHTETHNGESNDDEHSARLAAWQRRAEAPDVRSPQAFIRAGMASGDWPEPYVAASGEKPRLDVSGAREGAASIYARTGELERVEDWLAGLPNLSSSERELIAQEVSQSA